MKNKIQKITTILTFLASLIAVNVFRTQGVVAKDQVPQTAILDGSAGIEGILNTALLIISAGIGVVATGSIIVAGIMYSTAGADSGRVAAAKTMIKNTVIGVLAYTVMWALIDWLVPGGVIK